jgi:hypothetical protein
MNIIYHHLGLGDHIICNGLVRRLIPNNETFGLFVKKHNIKSVEFMFKDLNNLTMVPIDGDHNVSEFNSDNIIPIGHNKLGSTMNQFNCYWDEAFYRQMNINFTERWNSFFYKRDFIKEKKLHNELNPKNEDFVLIHKADSANVDRIDYSKISEKYKKIFVEKSETIFDYGLLIAKAKEVHCIDSSFKHLVDSIPTMGKLFYHKNYKPRGSSEHNQKKNWITI